MEDIQFIYTKGNCPECQKQGVEGQGTNRGREHKGMSILCFWEQEKHEARFVDPVLWK